MPGEYCEDDNICYSDTKCENKRCKGKELDQECQRSDDFSCDIGLACIQTQNNQFKCQNQLKQLEKCDNTYQCENDALCVGGICRNLLSINVGEEIKGSCYFLDSGIQLNTICKNFQCLTLNQTHFRCIEGYKTDVDPPLKKASYLKQCAAITDDFIEFANINCSYSNNGQSYCGAHLGDEKGLQMIEALQKIQGLSQGKCHTTKRLDPGCWYNRLNDHWDNFKSYYSHKQQFFFYPQVNCFYIQLDLTDKCTQYVYFNEYYNINYNAQKTYEEQKGYAFILSLIGSVLALFL